MNANNSNSFLLGGLKHAVSGKPPSGKALVLFISIMVFSSSTLWGKIYGDYEYTVKEDNTVEIIGYTGNDIEITIFSTIENKPVTSIGRQAFWRCDSLESITIPDSVTSIGGWAFANCDSLQSVSIPDSVISVGERAFFNCHSLQSVTVPDSVISIRERAFFDWNSLESVTIPDSITSIGDRAFQGCNSLQLVTMGDSFTSIGEEAFADCDSLESVTIPNSVTTIGGCAFANCDNLQSVTIGDSVTSIGILTFSGSDNLTDINVAEGNTAYSSDDGVLFNDDQTTIVRYPHSKARQSYTVPETVTSIGKIAFSSCDNLESVTIGDSITSIGNVAFINCKSLQSVTIGVSVTSIGNRAFQGCYNLTDITVAEGNTSYSSREGVLFNDNLTTIVRYPHSKAIQSYIVPETVTSIGESAFQRCDSLESVTIGDSVTSIGNGAFIKCKSLQSVMIGESVTTIGVLAFNVCDNLTDITVAEENTSYSSVDGVLLNDDQTTLIKYPIGNARESYTIPDSVTSIEGWAFANCASLESITIPDSVTSIGYWAFANCDSLQSVTMQDSVTSIENNAFGNCNSLKYACFTGDAPANSGFVFPDAHDDFTLYYHAGAEGFSTPRWELYPSVEIPPGSYFLALNQGSADKVYWPAGAAVTITAATPPEDKQFDKWTGDITHLEDVNAAETTITMPENNVFLTATYSEE